MQRLFQHNSDVSYGGVFDAIGFWLIIALIFLVPILFAPTVMVPFQFTKTFLIATLTLMSLIFFVIGRLKSQRVTIPIHPLFFTIWFIPVAYGLATVFSGGPVEFFGERINADSTGFMLIMALLATLTIALFRTKERILVAYLAFLASAGFLGIFVILRLLFGNAFLSFGGLFPTTAATPIGTLYDSGIFFGLIAVLTLVSLSTMRSRGWVKVVLVGELIMSVGFLTLVNVPVVWGIVALCSLGVFVGGLLSRFIKLRSHDVTNMFGQTSKQVEEGDFSSASLFILAAMLALFMSQGAITNMLANSLNISHVEVRPSWQTTVSIANDVFHMNPFFGSGPGTFAHDWSMYRPRELNNTIFWDSDFESGIGFIPTSFVTTGIVGSIAWIVFLSAFLFAGIHIFLTRAKKEDKVPTFLSLSSYLGALYLWTIAFFQSSTSILIALAFLVTGIFVASLSHRSVPTKEFSVVFADNPNFGFVTALILTLCFLGSIVGIFSAGQRYLAAIFYQKAAVTYQQSSNIEQAEGYMARSLVLYDSDTYLRFATDLSTVRLNTLINEQGASDTDRQNRFKTILTQAITSAQTATQRDPREYLNWMELGAVYARVVPLGIEGAYESAKRAYDNASALRPDSPSITLAYAYLERSKGNNDAAEKYIEKAVQLRPMFTEALFLMAQIQIEKGDIPKAIESVQATTVLDPQNPVTFFQLGLLNYSTGKYEESLAAFRKAVDLNGQYANARYFLGLTSWRLGNVEEAINQFVEIQKTNPDNAEVKTVLANLRAGKPPHDNITQVDYVQKRQGPPIGGE